MNGSFAFFFVTVFIIMILVIIYIASFKDDFNKEDIQKALAFVVVVSIIILVLSALGSL